MIQKVMLQNYRNFDEKVFSFSQKTVIVGDNGVGKTNVLEALSLLSTGKSMKTSKLVELIQFGHPIARIKGKVLSDEEATVLEVMLTQGILEENGLSKKVPKKRLLIDTVPKRIVDFGGIFKTVLFQPQDLELVTDSPSVRRNFLDTALSQTDRQYKRSLLSYEKGLRQRNKLLWKLREFGGSQTNLYFWDKLLIKEGNYLSDKRQQFLDFLNTHSTLGDHTYRVHYDKSAISETRLEQYKNEEVHAAATLVGPHRDDFQLFVKGEPERELAKFGSRGEMRMGVLWIKLNELNFIESEVGTRPTLLLDDIFSELDHTHREIVIQTIEKQQTIMTTADPHYVSEFPGVDTIQL